MNTKTIIRYSLLVLLVVMLGALAGWYYFLRSQTTATQSLDSSRGFTAGVPVGSAFGTGATAGSASSTSGTTSKPPQLWRIASTPAAGIGFATSTNGERVHYAEQATGYIFEADPTIGTVARLTNTLMAKTYQAIFAQGGIIERSVDADGAITTFVGSIKTATSTSLIGTSLVHNIQEIAPDQKSGGLVYLAPSGSGISLVSAAWDGTKSKTLFTSALTGWRVWALADGRTILAQKAADGLPGYAYTLSGGALSALVPPLPGLTILPRSGSGAIIYGMSSGAGPVLFVQLSASTTAVRLPIATVADKCLWAPGTALIAYCAVPQATPRGGFLDAWYRGELHTSDAWWKVDASSGQAQLIYTPPSNESLDVVDPVMDIGGEYIAFRNNADGTPWLLRLNQ